MTTHEPILQLQGITKSFAGTRVLSGVDFDLRAGEIHALMGENGAGKSTLMKVLGGVHAPDSGAIVIGGEHKVFATPGDAIAAGVAMIHQELSTVPEMTVAENLALGREPVRGVVLDRKRLRAEAEEKLAVVGGGIDRRTLVRKLSVGRSAGHT